MRTRTNILQKTYNEPPEDKLYQEYKVRNEASVEIQRASTDLLDH